MSDSDSENSGTDGFDEICSVQFESFMANINRNESELGTVGSFHCDAEDDNSANNTQTMETFFLQKMKALCRQSLVLVTVFENRVMCQFAVRHALSSIAFEELLQVVQHTQQRQPCLQKVYIN